MVSLLVSVNKNRNNYDGGDKHNDRDRNGDRNDNRIRGISFFFFEREKRISFTKREETWNVCKSNLVAVSNRRAFSVPVFQLSKKKRVF